MARTTTHEKLWIVKAGSQMVCSGGPLLLRTWMDQVATLKRKHGIQVIWVTSGAIATARDHFGSGAKKGTQLLHEKQALSAIGQPLVMDLYLMALRASGLDGAQILLTYGDLSRKEQRSNFKNTIQTLLKWNVIPVINENDAVATEEIRFGDNDSLSAKVAACLKADRLVILTDVAGLYDQDPRKNPNAKLQSRVDKITPSVLKGLKSAKPNAKGTGGMYSKVRAAQEALRAGIVTTLAKGDTPAVLTLLASGECLGTTLGAKRGSKR